MKRDKFSGFFLWLCKEHCLSFENPWFISYRWIPSEMGLITKNNTLWSWSIGWFRLLRRDLHTSNYDYRELIANRLTKLKPLLFKLAWAHERVKNLGCIVLKTHTIHWRILHVLPILGPTFLMREDWNAKHTYYDASLTTQKGRNLLHAISRRNCWYFTTDKPQQTTAKLQIC